MKVFDDGCSMYVAVDLDDALSQWEHDMGETAYEDEWDECNLDDEQTIWIEKHQYEIVEYPVGARVEPNGENCANVTATLRNWAALNGRGLLCSTEY